MSDIFQKPVGDEAVSEAQRGAMWAAREGRSTLGIPQSVGEEFTKGEKPVGDDEESAAFLQHWETLARGMLHWLREERAEPEHPGAEQAAAIDAFEESQHPRGPGGEFGSGGGQPFQQRDMNKAGYGGNKLATAYPEGFVQGVGPGAGNKPAWTPPVYRGYDAQDDEGEPAALPDPGTEEPAGTDIIKGVLPDFMPPRGEVDWSGLVATNAEAAVEAPAEEPAAAIEEPPEAPAEEEPPASVEEPEEDEAEEEAEDEAEDCPAAIDEVQPPAAAPVEDEIAYHGTRTAAIRSILDNGIQAHPNKRYHPGSFYEGARGGSVYLAADPQTALTWALTEVQNPDDATVLQVEVPPGSTVPDEYAEAAERYEGNIPPENIIAAFPIMPDGSLGAPQTISHSVGGEARFVALTHPIAAPQEQQQPPPAESIPSPDALPDAAPGALPDTPAPGQPPALMMRFVDLPGVGAIQDVSNGQIFGVDALIDHMAKQDDVPNFANFRDAMNRRAADPEALGMYVRSRLDPDWNPEKPGAIDASTWRRIRAAALDDSDPETLSGWAKGKLGPKKGAEDAAMAMDWSGVAALAVRNNLLELAFDQSTVRTKDEDGRLYVDIANISKATVNEYWGREIPRGSELGLDPNTKYRLLRDPKELAKAAATFNQLPILIEHQPLTADTHNPSLVIGSTGERAQFQAPYLTNSLVIWPQYAIDGIEGNKQRELSSAYHYDALMVPGVYEGQKYDGVMTNIRGNHLALVTDGRAGPDVIVGDSALEEDPQNPGWQALIRALRFT